MNRLMLIALGGFALASASTVRAQPLAPGEIELHIEAVGHVAPDTAIVPINLAGTGKDATAAAADLKRKEAELLASLGKLGIARDKAEFAKDDDPRYAEVQAVELAGNEAASDAARAGACAAAAAAEPGAASITDDCAGRTPETRVTRMVTIIVEDLTMLSAVTALGGGDNYYPGTQMSLFTRDPAASKARAVSQALAAARAEADTYAAALGYRVVRITRVSNAKPALNLPDIMGLIGGIALRGRSEREEMRGAIGATTAGAAMDFVIAPK